MIFCGDIALPFANAVKLDEIPDSIRKDVWFGNLEGSLITGEETNGVLQRRKVYNDLDAIKGLCEQINIQGFGIANNHLSDDAPVRTTIQHLESIGKVYVGAGLNVEEAKNPLVIDDFVIIAFGWEGIGCIPAKKKKEGVNKYEKWNVEQQVNNLLEKYPEKKVVCYMHWNYELEKYPQPYDRRMAMDLIDMGVSAVIGCHAHRIQSVEFYKGQPIVYGLGNFLFCQGHYMGGTLRFPKFCEEEYAFEIADDGNKFVVHHFHYDSCNNSLEFVKSEEISTDKVFDGKAEFTGFSAKDYEFWFKTHRVQKKLLPVFKVHESIATYFVKSMWIKIRGEMINLLTSVNLKSANRADRQ